MLKAVLVAASLAAPFAATPALAQRDTPPPLAGQTGNALVGLPIYSSDGQHLGQVVQVAESGTKMQGVRAEMGTFLGMGSAMVLIDADQFAQKPDRIEVAMTASEVKASLASQNPKTQ